MHIIAKRTLREFWESSPKYSDSQGPLQAWHSECAKASWVDPNYVKSQYRSVSFVKGKVVFNIAGNKYRLVVDIDYPRQLVFIKFVGTHKQYDEIDFESL